MEKFKKILGIYRLDAKKLALIGVLTAITAVIGMYCTIRIGAEIKITLKFIPVFLLASMFGPLWAGISCIISDVLAFIINPVAVFLPTITFAEFLYGFTAGLFYYKNKTSIPRIVLCNIVEIVFINLLLTSYFLIPIRGLSYQNLLLLRLPAAGLSFALRLVILISLKNTFKKIQ